MAWGGLAVIALTILFSLLSAMFSYWKCTCVHDLQEPLDDCLQATVNWIKPRLSCCCKDDSEDDVAAADVIEMENMVDHGGEG